MNIKVNFSIGETSVVLNAVLRTESNNPELAKRKLRGTILDEIFEFITACRKVRAKGFNLSKPAVIGFETENGINFSTGILSKHLQDTFKLRMTPEGKKAFAERFKILFEYATREGRSITEEQLIAELDAAILAKKLAKSGVKNDEIPAELQLDNVYDDVTP